MFLSKAFSFFWIEVLKENEITSLSD